MKDITNSKLLYFKGLLFLFGGMIASVIILIEHPNLKLAVLFAMSVWCFARAYYFVFYVIEHYIDNSYKFAGIWSFVIYIYRKKASAK